MGAFWWRLADTWVTGPFSLLGKNRSPERWCSKSSPQASPVLRQVQYSGKSTPFLLLSAVPRAQGFSRKCFITKMKLGMFVGPSIRVPWVVTLDLTSGIGVWSSAMERNIGKLHFSTSLNLCTLQNEKPVTWEHVKRCSSSPIHKCQSDRDALSLPIIPARVSQFGQPSAGLTRLWRNRVLEQSEGWCPDLCKLVQISFYLNKYQHHKYMYFEVSISNSGDLSCR